MPGLYTVTQKPISDWQLTAVGALSHVAILFLLVATAILLVWTWRSFDPNLRKRIRISILALRAAALLTAVLLLLQPTLSFRRLKSVPSELAIVVDVSGSMSRSSDGSRLLEVSRLLDTNSNNLKDLAKRHKLTFYSFADTLKAAASLEKALQPPSDPKGTEILAALKALRERDSSVPLSGILLLSDGADTAGQETLDETALKEFSNKLGVPVNTVAITLAGKRKDLSISLAKADSFAFSRTDTPISVEIHSTGIEEHTVDLTLWQEGSVVQRKSVELVGNKGRATFNMVPNRLGKQVLTITAPVPEDDEIPQNNTVHLSFDVIRDKFRVLHVAGQPSWDQRFLRDTLTSWPKLDIVSFYILRTVYQSTTQSSSGLALIPFPTEDLFENHLDEFDVIVFQDFDPLSVGVDAYLKKITSFVEEGGGLVLIGGTEGFDSGSIVKPPFSDILPVDLLPPGSPHDRTVDASPFRAKLTDAGKRHPIMKILKDPQANASLWRSAERLDGVVRVASRAKDSVTLAEHPFVNADDGPAPLIAIREVRKGRTMAITTNSTWRWRFEGPMKGGPPELYGEFWKRAILWLTKDPELDRLSIRIVSDKMTVESPVVAEFSLVDESYEPLPGAELECNFSWFDSADVEQSEKRNIRLDDDGRFQLEWQPKTVGPHTVTVTTDEGLEAKERFLVKAVGSELMHLDPNPAFLEKIAGATGGFHSVDTIELNKLKLAETPDKETLSREDTPLWNHAGTLALFLLLLTGEWLLRRRAGLN